MMMLRYTGLFCAVALFSSVHASGNRKITKVADLPKGFEILGCVPEAELCKTPLVLVSPKDPSEDEMQAGLHARGNKRLCDGKPRSVDQFYAEKGVFPRRARAGGPRPIPQVVIPQGSPTFDRTNSFSSTSSDASSLSEGSVTIPRPAPRPRLPGRAQDAVLVNNDAHTSPWDLCRRNYAERTRAKNIRKNLNALQPLIKARAFRLLKAELLELQEIRWRYRVYMDALDSARAHKKWKYRSKNAKKQNTDNYYKVEGCLRSVLRKILAVRRQMERRFKKEIRTVRSKNVGRIFDMGGSGIYYTFYDWEFDYFKPNRDNHRPSGGNKIRRRLTGLAARFERHLRQ